MVETRRQMAEEESRVTAASDYVAKHDITLSGFVGLGLELEEQQ